MWGCPLASACRCTHIYPEAHEDPHGHTRGQKGKARWNIKSDTCTWTLELWTKPKDSAVCRQLHLTSPGLFKSQGTARCLQLSNHTLQRLEENKTCQWALAALRLWLHNVTQENELEHQHWSYKHNYGLHFCSSAWHIARGNCLWQTKT